VVTVCLETRGPDIAREFVELAAPTHPSLVDEHHVMDARFGVVNIPNVIWIDEAGTIVRPPEPGWPPPTDHLPDFLRPARPSSGSGSGSTSRRTSFLAGGQDRAAYPDAVRDWARKGAASEFALSPDEVVARSHPRPLAVSQAAAEFALGDHLWRRGQRDAAIGHFDAAHRLQPENWTYKRQAWSMVSAERVEGPMGLFAQGPTGDDTEPWPFASDFRTDVAKLEAGEYYPNTF